MMAEDSLWFEMSIIFYMEEFMLNLSYREKALYGSLVAELLIFGPYFARVAMHPDGSLLPLFVRVVLFIVGVVVVEILVAVSTRHRQVDERDRLINWRSCRVAYMALIVCLSGMIGLAAEHDAVASSVVINEIMASVFAAYTVQVVTMLVMYRRSM
jgi:hypothetical protein